MHQKNTLPLEFTVTVTCDNAGRKFLLTVKASERTVIGQNPSPTLYLEETLQFCRWPRKTQRDGLE